MKRLATFRGSLILAAIFCIALTAVAAQAQIEKPAADAIQKSLLPTLQSAKQIRAFRIAAPPQIPAPTNSFLGYRILAESNETNAAFAKAVAGALLSEENYGPPGMTRCGFDPVVGFVVSDGTNSISIAVCFFCSEINIVPASNPRGGQMLRFKTSRSQLLRLAKQAFPNDEKLQKVREH